MNEPSATVEEKIILATIDCIERYGLSGATNRQIAQAAGVNLAAINYYFRSKENLIQRAMEITRKNAFDLGDLPPMQGASPAERCTAVLMHLVDGGHQYPGLTRAHFYNLLAQGHGDPSLVQHINRFIDELAGDLQRRGLTTPQDELKTSLTQMISAVLLPILAPTLFESQPGSDLQNRETALVYVQRLVEKLLA